MDHGPRTTDHEPRTTESVSCGGAAAAGVGGADSKAAGGIDHDALRVAEVVEVGLLPESVAHRFEPGTRVPVHAEGLPIDLIRKPLMMHAWRIDRLLKIHVEVHDIQDDLEHGIDDVG